MNFRIAEKMRNARTPPISGDVNQLAAMKPIEPQFTLLTPTETHPKPAIAPTIECVVETGQPRNAAMWIQSAAEISAAKVPVNPESAQVSVPKIAMARLAAEHF